MKRIHIPGLVNVFQVSDPKEIKALSNNPLLDRRFETRTCPLNWYLLKRALGVLSFRRRRFPTMTPHHDVAREQYQDDLWRRLNKDAADVRSGPVESAAIATWVRGVGSDEEIGILAQQFLGRLFKPDFTATSESWRAARVLVTAPRSRNLLKVLWWLVSGKLRRAKRLLAKAMDEDLSAVNAIGIAVHNVVKGLRLMRELFAEEGRRNALSAQAAAAQCLFAPVSVYRQATGPGKIGDCPFPKNSLFVFNIGEASRLQDGSTLVFMEDTWSRCPAASWVPAFLEGVWRRATAADKTL